MSEQTGPAASIFPDKQDPQAPLPSPSDYQRQAAQTGGVPWQQAAQQAIGQVVDPAAAGGSTDAGDTIEQIRAQVTRDVLLPMEQQIQQMMDDAREQQAALAAQVQQLQGQLAATQAQVGPPAARLYAESAAQRARAIAASRPDLGAQHFAPVIDAADQLAAGVKDVAAGSTAPGKIADMIAPVERWFTRHAHIEGAPALLAELGHLADEAVKLTAAAV